MERIGCKFGLNKSFKPDIIGENKIMIDQEDNKKRLLDFAKTLLINFIGGVVIILLAILLYTDIKEVFSRETVVQETSSEPSVQETRSEIVTEKILLEDLCYVEGKTSVTFGWGSGVLSENTYYVAYKILEDGGKMLIEIPTEGTIVYETLKSSENSYMEIDKNNIGFVKARRLYVPEGTKIPHSNVSEKVETEQ